MTRDDIISLLNVYGEAQFRAGAARQLVEGELSKLCVSAASAVPPASSPAASSPAPSLPSGHTQAHGEESAPSQVP